MKETLRIETRSILPVVGEDLTESLNRELSTLYDSNIEHTSFNSEPPAAGLTEIAFTIVATGAVSLVVEFFKPIVAAAGEAYRDEVLRLIREGRRSKHSDRGYIPLEIVLGEASSEQFSHGPVRYRFHGRLDETDLLTRLEAADEHLHSIPPEYFAGSGGPSENGFYWDEDRNEWRGTIWRHPDLPYGEFWIPRNVLDPER